MNISSVVAPNGTLGEAYKRLSFRSAEGCAIANPTRFFFSRISDIVLGYAPSAIDIGARVEVL